MRHASHNIPYLFDFFFEVDGITSARPGRLIDGYLAWGGFTLFLGRRHRLEVDIHALRAVLRWWWPRATA